MKLVRVFVVCLVMVGIASSGFAGDLQQSITKAATEQEPSRGGPIHIDRAYLIPGAALFVAGLSMAVYGFLHTNGGEFVSGQVSKESNTTLGGAGLAVAGAGGAILYMGVRRGRSSAPSIALGPHGVSVAKRLTW
jgi:hypothetical protein